MADLGAIGYLLGTDPTAIPARCVTGSVALLEGTLSPMPRRKVVLHRRSTSEVVAVSYSASDGSFTIPSTLRLHSELHFVVAFDSEGNDGRNALIVDRVTPVDIA